MNLHDDGNGVLWCDLKLFLDDQTNLNLYQQPQEQEEYKERFLTNSFTSSSSRNTKPSLGSQYLSEYKWSKNGKLLWFEIIKYYQIIVFCYKSSNRKRDWTYSQCNKWCERELNQIYNTNNQKKKLEYRIVIYSSLHELRQFFMTMKEECHPLILITNNIKLQHLWKEFHGKFLEFSSPSLLMELSSQLQTYSLKKDEKQFHLLPSLPNEPPQVSLEQCEMKHPFLCKIIQNILMIISYSDRLGFENLHYYDKINPIWRKILLDDDDQSTYDLSEVLSTLMSKPLCCRILITLCYIFIFGEVRVELDEMDTHSTVTTIFQEILKTYNPLLHSCHQCQTMKWGPVNMSKGMSFHLTDSRIKLYLEAKDCATRDWSLSASMNVDLRSIDLIVRAYCITGSPMWVLGNHTITAAEFFHHPLETVYCSPSHLMAYRDACEWRYLLSSLIKRSQSNHKDVEINQWDMLTNNIVVNDRLENSKIDLLIEDTVDFILIGWKDSSQTISFHSQSIPWNEYSLLSPFFLESQSFHYLPAWPIVTGLLEFISYLEHRSRWKKKQFSINSEWKDDNLLNIHLLNFLMDTPKFRTYCGGNYLEKMCWSIRGKCWVHLFYNMRQIGYCTSDIRDKLAQALEECGQLPECGGLSPVDVEEIESLAVLYRGSQFGRPSKREGYAAYRASRNIQKLVTSEILTPPKRYSLANIHHTRYFQGDVVRFMNLEDGISKRRRLIYKKTYDRQHRTKLEYSANPPVTSDTMKQFNHRDREMIVEKFALCRYLSLIDPMTTVPDIHLHLYDDEDIDTNTSTNTTTTTSIRRVKDMLITNRGPGSWIHASIIQPQYSRKWLASYCEGKVWLSIFTLFYWELIYDSSLSYGMMRFYFNRPLDLLPERDPFSSLSHSSSTSITVHCSTFYSRRRSSIHILLNQIKNYTTIELFQYFTHRLQQYQTIQKPCWNINWKKLDCDLILSIICSLGSKRLCQIMYEMVRDPVTYSRGMPDLLFCLHYQYFLQQTIQPLALNTQENQAHARKIKKHSLHDDEDDSTGTSHTPWNTETIFVVEVKSPNDQLSVWQKLWIKLLKSAKIYFEECRVN